MQPWVIFTRCTCMEKARTHRLWSLAVVSSLAAMVAFAPGASAKDKHDRGHGRGHAYGHERQESRGYDRGYDRGYPRRYVDRRDYAPQPYYAQPRAYAPPGVSVFLPFR